MALGFDFFATSSSAIRLEMERACDVEACFGSADFFDEKPPSRFGASTLLARGGHNKVYGLEVTSTVLRTRMQSLGDAEASVKEAYLMTALGRAGVAPRVHNFGWTPDGKPWSLQDRAEGSLAQWLASLASLPLESRRLARRLKTWRLRTAPSLLRALRSFASMGLYPTDLNPNNVVLRKGGGAQIIDFDPRYVAASDGADDRQCQRPFAWAVAVLASHLSNFAEDEAGRYRHALAVALVEPFPAALASMGALEAPKAESLLALHRQFVSASAALPSSQGPGRFPEAFAAVPCASSAFWGMQQLEALLYRVRRAFLARRAATEGWDPTLWVRCLRECLSVRPGRQRELSLFFSVLLFTHHPDLVGRSFHGFPPGGRHANVV